MRAAVITCITDGYETLKPVCPQVGADVEWICVTDGAPLPAAENAEGWTMICDPSLRGQHPNRAAKRPKLEPWRYTEAPASVWIDGSYRVTSPHFVADVLALAAPIAQFLHPWRDCCIEEAEFSATLGKYAGEPLVLQAKTYVERGMPRHWGLWATGVIARHHTPEVKYLGEKWRDEIGQWSFQDQVSEPYALRKSYLRPVTLPGDHLTNPWLNYEGSWRH
jgi:Protein of unknown function (DUF616)